MGWVRLLVTRAIALLDSDSVRPYIWLYYVPFLLWGVYGTFFAYPIDLVAHPMGQGVYDAWVFAPIPGTLVVMFGLYLRNGDSPLQEINRRLLRRDYLGLYLQFGGHMLMHVVLLVFVIAAVAGASWGDPVISVFLFSSYVVGTALLSAQCFRKIQRGRRFQSC